ncbi:LCP family protein [Nocardioidaceae bacterium]|nr:LCP family protein [Nocardioidaceae bacterium]
MSRRAAPSVPASSSPRRRSRLKITAAVLAALAVVVVGGLVVVYEKLDGNLNVTDVAGQLRDRPEQSPLPTGEDGEEPTAPVNILVIGSDTRAGEGNGIDDQNPGQRSDTNILLHLSGDRSFAYGVSIARDTVVERPDCYTDTGEVIPGGLDMWNAAYEEGGAACLIQQTEQLTGVRIDDFVEIDFNGFREMVDALGGVTVCVPEEVNDTTGNIYLPAGTYEVEGQQALDYVRVRYSVGNGSDVGRMKRQQAFMATMVNEATSAGTLANPVKLYNFLDAATESLTISSGLGSLADLVGLARQVNGIGLDRVQFTSVPIRQYEPDPNRLEWKPRAAERLWELIRTDQPLSGGLTKDVVTAAEGVPGSEPSDSPSATASASAIPDPEESAKAAAEAERRLANGLCA